MLRRRVVAGNWKMHLGPTEARAFLEALRLPEFGDDGPEVIVFPASVSLLALAESPRRDDRIQLGVQNVHFEVSGAFTGEVSAVMAKDAGASHALVGHSERRHVFGEDDDVTRAKLGAVAAAGLTPILCVGETLEERREGRLGEVLARQLVSAAGEAPEDILLAYEPVWAIGTGETASPEDAADAHALLRRTLAETLGSEAAERIRILYGGSVKPTNVDDLLAAPGVDGVLVGGASLDPHSFGRLVAAAV